ncbi:MAG: cytochrome d ubiquinol oxidase subunit II [Mycobacteriaceae bacterium]|nr:cytochrome d ubiquinol oxidase subunit II [Mycobacteriaceae bacterium]
MSLQTAWFVLITVLFIGYFVLEGFDFGVGMLMPVLGRGDDARRRTVLNTIGPVWDGNEVWLITGGGALFAAFPEWYASLVSGFYRPLLVVLLALILRIVAIEWRGKIDDPRWRARCDLGIGIGSWVPAIAWGLVFANVVRGVPVDANKAVHLGFSDLFNPYAVTGALTTTLLFALHGAVFLALKTAEEVRADAVRAIRALWIPAAVAVAAFGLWTQLSYGKGWTWFAVVAAVAGLALAAGAALAGRDGWAFLGTAVTVVAATVLLFGSLFPNVLPSTTDSAFDLTIHNASATPYTLRVMTWVAAFMTPIVLIYQGWTYWVFRNRISRANIPAPIGLPMREVAEP